MATAQVQHASAHQREVTQRSQVTHEHTIQRAQVVVLAFATMILGGIALDIALLAATGLLAQAVASVEHLPPGVLLGSAVILLVVAIPGGRWEVQRLWQAHIENERNRRIAELSPLAGLLHVSPLALDCVTVKTLHDLSPTAFELAMGDLLKLYNYRDVRHTGGSGDLCVDLTAVDPKGKHIVVQCKRYAPGSPVTSPEVQTFLGMVTYYHHVPFGLYFTTSHYTRDARKLADAEADHLKLVDGDQLVAMVHALAVK